MSKLVKLSLETRSPEPGYKVKLVEIKEEVQQGGDLHEEVDGTLPAVDKIYDKYQSWCNKYSQFSAAWRRPIFRQDIKLSQEICLEDSYQLYESLKQDINNWLDAPGFRKIEEQLRTRLETDDNIRFVIKTKDEKLWKLPWSAWDLFDDNTFRYAQVGFSPSKPSSREQRLNTTPRKKVKILAIFGDSTGIDYQKDRETIKQLRSADAEPQELIEPTQQELRNRLRYHSWDILFFAGHSDSQPDKQTGRMHLGKGETITPDELKATLKTAVENGLKIAILNSCDGLWLAHQLVTESQIPLVIAMREPVPNKVAQVFLNSFLIAYADQKKPLYTALREAKESIAEQFQKEFPGIDWLPIICQNPAIRPPLWQELHREVSLKQVGIFSLACTSLVILGRFLGVWQPVELWAFDRLMQLRPPEAMDERLLIVGVTEEDIREEDKFPISDLTLARVMQNLEKYSPRAIGLDIYRGEQVPGGGREELLKYLRESDRVVPVCRLQESKSANVGVQPPPGLSKERLGFSDLPEDKDGFIRLQFLFMKPDDKDSCNTPFSFSYQLASRYLKQESGIEFAPHEADNYFRFTEQDSPSFNILKPHTGGYQRLDEQEDLGGFQTLLNYRASKKIAEEVSLGEVLEGNIDPNSVANRVVLIGYTAESEKDIHDTTISQNMPGVIIHGHMVSQILSAVLDDRPLLWTLPWWGDFFFVLGCSCFGGLLVWKLQKPLFLSLAEGLLVIVLPIGCLLILINGGWMPLIPSAIALVATFGSLLVYIIYPNLQKAR
ncbi:MAG: CHASE2 domain-containing protein [Symploca sp. SIO2G7]|nr:CHASE2 domain-containing protein [Symploca sp. SIO2G7]